MSTQNSTKHIKKYRPYLTYPELFAISQSLQNTNNSPSFLLMSLQDRKSSMDAQYVITSLLRDIEYDKKVPALTTTNTVPNARVSGIDMFSESEIVNTVINSNARKSDNEILANASEYEQELIFLNNDLNMGFIPKELYDSKLLSLWLKHNVSNDKKE